MVHILKIAREKRRNEMDIKKGLPDYKRERE